MEIKTPAVKDKAQKMTIDQTIDVETEDVYTSKKETTQEIDEEKLETMFVETRPDQLIFQVTLEDPLQTVASSSLEVAISSSKGSATATEIRWPIINAIE